MKTTVLANTVYGPEGKPYACEVTLTSGLKNVGWYWTEQEAWDARDRLFEMGFKRVRVIGAATVVAGF